jgi:hypothetical protein
VPVVFGRMDGSAAPRQPWPTTSKQSDPKPARKPCANCLI